MKTVGLLELSETKEFNISSIFAIEQHWDKGQSFSMKSPRKQSAFLWFCGSSGRFVTEGGNKIEASRGTLVYIPEGAVYEITFLDKSADISTAVLIEFCLDCGEPTVLFDSITPIESAGEDIVVTELIKKIASEYGRPSKPYLKLHRDLFGLLSLLSAGEDRNRISRKGFKTIEKGIEYLQKDEKQEMSIDEIAKMCFVTPAYFRRLFREYSGVSPSEYRTSRRIERARLLMEHTDNSVEAVADAVGYDDPSYFCRMFKKATGMSPSEYKKNIENER
ncbi:MAG: helix-turn-helix transcriptional regulator [Clostridia bacterium]|nr:helix-turn-helix transcriptional regulator [Clostridia bacterium]